MVRTLRPSGLRAHPVSPPSIPRPGTLSQPQPSRRAAATRARTTHTHLPIYLHLAQRMWRNKDAAPIEDEVVNKVSRHAEVNI